MNSTEPTTPSGLSSRTKNMLVIVAIIGAIIIGALLIYSILVAPARQPYREALTQYQNVGRANAALNTAGANLNAGTATDEAFQKSVETARAMIASLETENSALGKKEVLTNGEGKELYDAFNAKLQLYIDYNDNLLTSMLAVRPVLHDCNQSMANSTESGASVKAIRACATELGKLKNIPDTDYKAMTASFHDTYTELATIIEKMAALKDPKGKDTSKHQALTSQRDEVVKSLSTISTTFSQNVQKHRIAIITIDESGKLEEYLNDKSRVF